MPIASCGIRPQLPDPLVAEIEALSYLGRDEDVIVLSAAVDQLSEIDPDLRAIAYHHLAVAYSRIGDDEQSRAMWKKCLKLMPTHHEAAANLEDVDTCAGHARGPNHLASGFQQPR